MNHHDPKELAALGLELLGKLQPGDGIDIETTCGQTVTRVFVKREHRNQPPQPTTETQGT